MSFMAEMAALAAEFAQNDMMTDAVITRAIVGAVDPIAGKVTGSLSTLDCRAVAGLSKVANERGVVVESTVIVSNVEIKPGDIVAIGSLDYTIGAVTAVAPHGTAILWRGVAQ